MALSLWLNVELHEVEYLPLNITTFVLLLVFLNFKLMLMPDENSEDHLTGMKIFHSGGQRRRLLGVCLCVMLQRSELYLNLNLYNYRFPCEFSAERTRENEVYEEEMRGEMKWRENHVSRGRRRRRSVWERRESLLGIVGVTEHFPLLGNLWNQITVEQSQTLRSEPQRSRETEMKMIWV